MCELSQKLSVFYQESTSEAEYQNKIKESIQDSLTFSCSINENQILQVNISPLYPKKSLFLYFYRNKCIYV